MDVPSIFTPDFAPRDDAPAPFTARHAAVGRQAGARQLGASVYELAPGESVCPFHFHHANEELLVVLSGRASVRTAAGCATLGPGEVLAFPAGACGAHRVDNAGDDSARVLIVSTMHAPDIVEYPDSNKLMARSQAAGARPIAADALRLVLPRDAAVGYYDGEV